MQQIALDIGYARTPSLQDFMVGSNEAAYMALRDWLAVCHHLPHERARAVVPLYLWGTAGSGKTHLLQAAAASVQQLDGRIGHLYAGAQELAFDTQWAAIVLDEVERYSAAQQQQAFDWLVRAQGAHIPVLAAGNAAPAQLPVREDLRTRLGWGHVYALNALTEAERRAVLRQEADNRGILLSDEVLNFMLNTFSRDLASLMQLLQQIDGYALSTKRAVTIPLIKSMLQAQ